MAKKNNKKNIKTIRMVLIPVVIAILLGGFLFAKIKTSKVSDIPYNQFIQMVDKNEVKEVEFSLVEPKVDFKGTDGKLYKTDNPRTNDFKLYLLKKGVPVKEHGRNTLLSIIGSLINYIWIIFLATFLYKSMKGMSKTEMTNPVEANTSKKVTFDDVVGLKPVKKDAETIVDFLKNPKKYNEMGAELPKGAILYGDPGTGKTLLAKAIAGEAGVPFFSATGSDFIEMFAGLGAKRVRELFKKARENSPCIIFIDEIDAVGGKRTSSYGNEEQRQTLNALLSEMDGFNNGDGVLVICATNRIEDLDSALIRPGRFDAHIRVPLPETPSDRKAIIQLYLKNKKVSEDFNIDRLAKDTMGFSPADIATLINDATLISIQDKKKAIDDECFEKAIFKKLLKGHAVEDNGERDKEEIKLVAWHEAGHAVIGKIYGMDISKVTIVQSTSGAGGVNIIVPKKMGLYSVEELEQKVKMSYGGRIAEYLLFGDNKKVTTGASADIQNATNIISGMISHYGMTEKYGMLNLEQLKINQDIIVEESVRISKNLYSEAKQLLEDNKDFLEELVDVLLEKETITGEELDKIAKKYLAKDNQKIIEADFTSAV